MPYTTTSNERRAQCSLYDLARRRYCCPRTRIAKNTHMVWEGRRAAADRCRRQHLPAAARQSRPAESCAAFSLNAFARRSYQRAGGATVSAVASGLPGRLPIYGNAPTLALAQRVVKAFELESHQAQVDWVVVAGGEEVPPTPRLPAAGSRYGIMPCLALRFEDRSSGKVYWPTPSHQLCGDAQWRGGADPRGHSRCCRGRQSRRAVKLGLWPPPLAARLVLVHFSPWPI